MNRLRAIASSLLPLAALSLVGCGGSGGTLAVDDVAQDLTAQFVIAEMAPTGLVQSTGNVYWTINATTTTATSVGKVYRSGKTSPPGSEILLYSESSGWPQSFGAITWALVDGNYYGYFVVSAWRRGSVIKRVPLTGGSATTMGSISIAAGSPLYNDGTSLFYFDANALYSMDLRSGAVTTLVSAAGITALALAPYRVYYAAGTSVYYKSTVGSLPPYLVSQRSSAVKFMAVEPGSNGANTVFVSDGSYVGDLYSAWGAAPSGHHITGMAWDGSRLIWSECASTNTVCGGGFRHPADFLPTTYAGLSDNAHNLMGDSSEILYVSNTELIRGLY